MSKDIEVENSLKNVPVFSRKKGTIALLFSSYASIVIVIIKGIVLVPVYLHYIDSRLYGAWLASGSIIAYFGLLDFGLNGVLLQRVASNYGKGDIDRLGSLLGTGLIIGSGLSVLPLLLGFLLSPWVPDIVKISGAGSVQLRLAFILAALGTSLMLIMYTVGGVLVALQRQIVHGVMLFIGDVLGIATIIIMLASGYGLTAIPVGTIVWALFSASGDGIYLLWFVKRRLPAIHVRFNKKEVRDLSHKSVWLLGSRTATTIARGSDNLIIATLIDPRLCTVFTFTKKAADILAMLVKHIAGAFLPGLSHLHGENDEGKFKKITLLLFKITSLLGICFMGSFFFLNEAFLGLWVGPEYYGGIVLSGLFCIYGFFIILATTFYNIIFAKGKIITTAKVYIAEAVIRIPLSVGLVILWGIKGAALAAVLAVLPTSFFMQAKSFIKELNLSRSNILKVLRVIGLQIFIVYTMGILMNGFWTPEGVFEFISFGGLYLLAVLSVCISIDIELRSKALNAQKKFFNKYFLREQT